MDFCKDHKDIINNCPPFRPILSVTNTPTYLEQDSDFFMGSLNVDSLFNNIPPQETIDWWGFD